MSQTQGSQSQVKILITDDKADNLTVLEAVLSSEDYVLMRAQSGREAVELARHNTFACVLLDIQMPIMDGFETAEQIRSLPGCKTVPIIFLTAIYGDEAYVNHGYCSGAVDYIFKPFSPNILKSKVKVFVDLFRSHELVLRQAEELREKELALIKATSSEKQRNMETKYTELIENIDHSIIWSMNTETNVLSFVSPAAEKLTGYKVSEWSNLLQFWKTHIVSEDRRRFLDAVDEARKGKKNRVEHRFVSANGDILWFQTGIYLSGVELRGMSVDITGVKKAEDSQRFIAEAGSLLARSLNYDETLKKITELLVPRVADWCSIELIDEDGNVSTVAALHKSVTKTQAIFEFKDLCKSEGLEFGSNKVRATGITESGVPPISEALRNSKCYSLLSDLGCRSYICAPLMARGRVIGTVKVVSINYVYTSFDVKFVEELARLMALAVENARLFKNAEEAILYRDQFLSIASHELKTPLTPLKLQVQSIKRIANTGRIASLSPAELERIFTRSDRQIDRIIKLVEDLLNVSKINLGRMNLERRRTELPTIISEVLEQFGEEIRNSGSQVEVDVDPTLVGHWDPFRVEQILINLLTNAIKYGGGKAIRIQAYKDGEWAVLKVTDSGIGIDLPDQQRIFSVFERAASAKNYGGLGLGLYIVKTIVERHGGSIGVSSQIGNGSIFTVKLPREMGEFRPEVNTKVGAASYVH